MLELAEAYFSSVKLVDAALCAPYKGNGPLQCNSTMGVRQGMQGWAYM